MSRAFAPDATTAAQELPGRHIGDGPQDATYRSGRRTQRQQCQTGPCRRAEHGDEKERGQVPTGRPGHRGEQYPDRTVHADQPGIGPPPSGGRQHPAHRGLYGVTGQAGSQQRDPAGVRQQPVGPQRGGRDDQPSGTQTDTGGDSEWAGVGCGRGAAVTRVCVLVRMPAVALRRHRPCRLLQ
ncbi:hypothetical protein [Corynebacterium variabile]|uniref:hypothetical protein n=1 Tax=Corynebacterium variabile TaxID=1727 RepID=UPI002FE16B0D